MNALSSGLAEKIVLFHRDFQQFTGGHLKVWDYFNHVAASPAFGPRIAFTPESKLDETNPWSSSLKYFTEWAPEKADLLFLAGTDWRALTDAQRAKPSKPIINLIQHQRHADSKSELRSYLRHRATRICVSDEVAAAIKETGEVNGPVFVIPNGIDCSSVPKPPPMSERKIDILICGLKAPDLARALAAALADKNAIVQSVTEWMPRQEFLETAGQAKITIFLPRPVEGFFLPALEGMACDTVVVCPDCQGNRGFCIDGANCFRPNLNLQAILAATNAAMAQSPVDRTRMLERAKATVMKHSLSNEREKFLRILTQIEL